MWWKMTMWLRIRNSDISNELNLNVWSYKQLISILTANKRLHWFANKCGNGTRLKSCWESAWVRELPTKKTNAKTEKNDKFTYTQITYIKTRKLEMEDYVFIQSYSVGLNPSSILIPQGEMACMPKQNKNKLLIL